jgi:hypothetical protein
MLWALLAIVLILWLLGFVVLSTPLIHLLLLVALIILLYNLFVGRRTVV